MYFEIVLDCFESNKICIRFIILVRFGYSLVLIIIFTLFFNYFIEYLFFWKIENIVNKWELFFIVKGLCYLLRDRKMLVVLYSCNV